MTDDRLHRHEVAPGCFLVSTEGTSRSGDTMRDAVRSICEGAVQRAKRPAR